MFRREIGSKRGSLPPKEGDLTCMCFMHIVEHMTSILDIIFTDHLMRVAITYLYQTNISRNACGTHQQRQDRQTKWMDKQATK